MENLKYGNTIVSSRADDTLTYSKFIKDLDSGKSVSSILGEFADHFNSIKGSVFKGMAVPNTTPSGDYFNGFFVATKAGTYSAFDNLAIAQDGAYIIHWIDGNWHLYDMIANGGITTDKLADNSVTIRQIAEDAISNGKLQDGSVDSRNIQEDAVVTNKIADKNVTTEKLAERSVTNSKIADKSITNDKVANNTLTLDKLDADLRDAIEAATGLPSDLFEKVQNLTEDVAELQDSEFPITLYLQVNYKASTDMAIVTYSVNRKGQPLVPDTMILKSGNETLLNTPSSGGMVQALVTHNMHIVTLDVTYGKMSKQASITRYICYSGSSTSDVISSGVLNTLSKSYVPNVSFNPSVTTKNGEYIWLVVPQYLTISSVKSAGFDVTLDTPQTIKTDLGDFKAYRTKNSLTANNWKLVIE